MTSGRTEMLTTSCMCDTYTTIGCSTISHVIRTIFISSTNYFRQSPQLQKTIVIEHANTTGCSHNVLRVSLILILFIEIIPTFINILRGYVFNIVVLRSVNILLNKRMCTCVVSECPFNCLTCTDTLDGVPTMKCKTCAYQYVLNDGDCGACPRYCLKCSESQNGLTCTQCQNKTVMMSDGTCERK